jgi:hypothetical protein
MMHDIVLSRHAEARMRQRGFRDTDIQFVLDAATPIADDAVLLTEKDVAREITKRKREIQDLERLKGSTLVVEDGVLVTVYHAKWRSPRSHCSTRRRMR